MRVRLYLDTNVVIALVEGEDVLARGIGRLLLLPGVEAVTSELTLSEVLVRPLRALRTSVSTGWPPAPWTPATLVSTYRHLLRRDGDLVVVPASSAIWEMAALVRADDAGLKLPDAVHLATAVDGNSTHLLSGDARMTRAAGSYGLTPTDLTIAAVDALAGVLS